MSTPEKYMAAHKGRVGADRMQLGLSIIPDKLRGDMEVVAKLRARLEKAEAILTELGNGYWVSILDAKDFPVELKMGQKVLKYWQEAK